MSLPKSAGEPSFWTGIGVPRNTRAEIVDKLNTEINAALADPKMKAPLADLGGAPPVVGALFIIVHEPRVLDPDRPLLHHGPQPHLPHILYDGSDYRPTGFDEMPIPMWVIGPFELADYRRKCPLSGVTGNTRQSDAIGPISDIGCGRRLSNLGKSTSFGPVAQTDKMLFRT
jgi:hypothetical protein